MISPVRHDIALSHTFDVSSGISSGTREGGELRGEEDEEEKREIKDQREGRKYLADITENGSPILRILIAILRGAESNNCDG